METITDELKVIQMINEFADSQHLINAVYKGVDPENGSLTYYLINLNQKFNIELENAISDLEWKITGQTNYDCNLASWPTLNEQTSNYKFLGECIYECP